MHIHTKYRAMDDFTQCMVSNSRMAARAITRRYDAYARPFGITSTQFSLLGVIVAAGEQTVSELAEARGFERTTLTRNLDRLEKMGLIASRPAEHGNGRICGLTDKGHALVEQLLPFWRKAQAEIKEELGAAGFDDTLKTLKRLAAV
ncbi:MarR family winged helix-turn-helix transcriptional regulator [Devosia sp.]|uniref:MarR family winged helix-turn-helix transcriptional regulator n=1 Tax=Devosia sp. TaxID=1871048 RepID=UPI002620A2C7|nr:MarR family winged helix-turn-helix transcriptional regulator [Devosia sp.]